MFCKRGLGAYKRRMPNNRGSVNTGLFIAGLSLPRGAGGGRMWFDEVPEQGVSRLRAHEALATRARTLATVCPFC